MIPPLRYCVSSHAAALMPECTHPPDLPRLLLQTDDEGMLYFGTCQFLRPSTVVVVPEFSIRDAMPEHATVRACSPALCLPGTVRSIPSGCCSGRADPKNSRREHQGRWYGARGCANPLPPRARQCLLTPEDNTVMNGGQMCLLLLPEHTGVFSFFYRGCWTTGNRSSYDLFCSHFPFSSVIGSAGII